MQVFNVITDFVPRLALRVPRSALVNRVSLSALLIRLFCRLYKCCLHYEDYSRKRPASVTKSFPRVSANEGFTVLKKIL